MKKKHLSASNTISTKTKSAALKLKTTIFKVKAQNSALRIRKKTCYFDLQLQNIENRFKFAAKPLCNTEQQRLNIFYRKPFDIFFSQVGRTKTLAGRGCITVVDNL